jgi:hypothetical protein
MRKKSKSQILLDLEVLEENDISGTLTSSPIENPDLVVLRNPVAKARFHLSVYQTKFLLEMLSYLKSRPNDRILEFNIRKFNNSMDLDSNNLGYYVDEIRKMVRHVISLPVEELSGAAAGARRFKEVALIAAIDTDIDGKGEGYIRIEVADMIKPYFLEIANGQFFSFHKYNSLVLKSKYSIGIYMLLKSYQRFALFQISYKELRDILEIKPNEYHPFKEFKRWILERSREEMLEKNDIYFDYEVVRSTKSPKSEVQQIVFTIKENPRKAELSQRLAQNSHQHFVRLPESAAVKPKPLLPLSTLPEMNEKALFDTVDLSHLEKAMSEISLLGDDSATTWLTEIIEAYRFFDKETPEEVLTIFIDGLKANFYSEERILDVLYFAQERVSKGEKIRNIMGYIKKGVEGGLMGKGLAQSKRVEKQVEVEHQKIMRWFDSQAFKNDLKQYFIQKGINADNDIKLRFLAAVKKQRKVNGYFDEDGKILDHYKDNFRELLGKKIAEMQGETQDSIFIRWVETKQGALIEKKGQRFVMKKMDI